MILEFKFVNFDDEATIEMDAETKVMTVTSEEGLESIFETPSELAFGMEVIKQIIAMMKKCEIHTVEVKEKEE